MQPFEFIGTYCSSNGSLQACLQGAYNMGLAIAIALAFLMAVIGAFQYLLGAAINVKEDGKKRIIGSIYGLAVIFVSGVVLYWINPSIFSAEFITFRVSELTPPTLEGGAEGGSWQTNRPAAGAPSPTTIYTPTASGSDCGPAVRQTINGGRIVWISNGTIPGIRPQGGGRGGEPAGQEDINELIVPALRRLGQSLPSGKFIWLTDAFGPGHRSRCHTQTGTCADLVPGGGLTFQQLLDLLVQNGFRVVNESGRTLQCGGNSLPPTTFAHTSGAHLHAIPPLP